MSEQIAERDPPCTDCYDTGYNPNTERQCTCHAAANIERTNMTSELPVTDITERLRAKYCCTTEDCNCDEAAAEIERLRDALQYCADAPFSGWTIAQGVARRALTPQ